MNGKLIIKSKLKVLTGLHIGGSSSFSAIGALDSPVVVDVFTRRPIIPGSSLKGKLRTLLAISVVGDIKHLSEPNNDLRHIRRLFGASGGEDGIMPSRLQFTDAFLSHNEKEKFSQIGYTEIKTENTIDRLNSIATPRQIERVISGAIFDVRIVYNIFDPNELDEDINNLVKAIKLLQLDYLGGNGTRGSGRVSFSDFKIDYFDGHSISDNGHEDSHDFINSLFLDTGISVKEKLNQLTKKFEEVKNYALLHI